MNFDKKQNNTRTLSKLARFYIYDRLLTKINVTASVLNLLTKFGHLLL